MTRFFIFAALLFCASACSTETTLKEGQAAPDFTLKTDAGQSVTLSSLKGKMVVLYFYPKDGTPGCTKEACAFRDAFADYQTAGIEVLGVSVDDEASHQKFKQEQNLNFTLLADSNKEVSKSYGVLNAMGLSSRVTFLIDKEGKLKKIFKDVSPESHAKDVLAAAKS
jgi:thioredoxin-dependent peroxiredoxin